jgi:predicted flavoprotein YhiN
LPFVCPINFLPDFSEDMLAQELQRRFSRDAGIQDAAESLRGLLNHKLIPVILKAAGIPVHEHTERISQKQTETLCRQIHIKNAKNIFAIMTA